MRSLVALAAVLSLLFVTGCAREQRPTATPTSVDRRLTIGIGFEDVMAGRARLDELSRRLDDVHARGVTLGVGRPEWTAFPWSDFPDAAADGGSDHVREAIDALGRGREITLVIDVLSPRLLERFPAEAGVSSGGRRSTLTPGAASFANGEVGRRIVALCGAVAERYRPARVALTEFFLEDTFSDADLALYKEMTGRRDWPRTASGDIDTSHASISDFRSEVVSTVAGRCDEAAAKHGVQTEMDVRAPWSDPTAGRRESGHDYKQLLGRVDRLTVWNYFALANRKPGWSSTMTQGLQKQLGPDVSRVTLSVGLWSGGAENQTDAHTAVVSAKDMAEGVKASLTHGITSVSVTPASRMTDEHWKALADLNFPR